MFYNKNKMEELYPKLYLYKRIVQAKLFIDTHYSEKLDLDIIANKACFSKFYFIKLFKSIYKVTPYQYLIKVRIDKAKLFLQNKTLVSDVCFSIGFDSISSFTGLFKKYNNLTPYQYLQLFERRQQEIKHIPLKFIPNCFVEKERDKK